MSRHAEKRRFLASPGDFWSLSKNTGLTQTDDDRSSAEVFFFAAGEAHGCVSLGFFGGRVVGIGGLATAKQSAVHHK